MGTPQAPLLSSPLDQLAGVGPATAGRLARIGLTQLSDLLFHLPLRYVDRTRLVPLGALRPGQDALVEGTIDLAQVKFGRRRSLLVRISDGTGALVLRFFHFGKAQQATLERGATLRCFGQVRGGNGTLEIIHPEYRRLEAGDQEALETALTPVYPTTERLSQGVLRRLTAMALEALSGHPDDMQDLLPGSVMRGLGLPGLRTALEYIHRPPPGAETDRLLAGTHPSQRRLAFEELLAHQVSLRLLRTRVQTRSAPVLALASDGAAVRFLAALPFRLTGAQQRALDTVRRELASPRPMLRLIQGDVGSGKTVVAAAAAAQAVAAGYQAALLAPTELLAEQHHRNLSRWFGPAGFGLLLLTGRAGARERREYQARLGASEPLLAVGTHALLQEAVSFSRLGLAIVDEQHRFGVHQRLALLEKGLQAEHPHQLVLTATPIPRTLAMTVFADLDVSVIDELPPGRREVQTLVSSAERRGDVLAGIRNVCAEGRQAYWVCPRIEEYGDDPFHAAEEAARMLTERLPGLRIGLVHGRMPPRERDRAMDRFREGGFDVLVATTVIEVGVDVSNATLMVIENSERLGLAQLHQLRGRVGRGEHGGTCVLLYRNPLSALARERLETMRATCDGFEIAEKDLELRGPGEILGTRQTGLQRMRIADLARDARMIPQVQRVADLLVARHPATLQPLMRRWLNPESGLGTV